jgi:hypothetical protein
LTQGKPPASVFSFGYPLGQNSLAVFLSQFLVVSQPVSLVDPDFGYGEARSAWAKPYHEARAARFFVSHNDANAHTPIRVRLV